MNHKWFIANQPIRRIPDEGARTIWGEYLRPLDCTCLQDLAWGRVQPTQARYSRLEQGRPAGRGAQRGGAGGWGRAQGPTGQEPSSGSVVQKGSFGKVEHVYSGTHGHRKGSAESLNSRAQELVKGGQRQKQLCE
jgi:hypothetical protein